MTRQLRRRGGFTLIELLVVIAIIAILVSLTTAAVMQFLKKREDVLTRNEIAQLATDVEVFHQKLKVYPPGIIFLANNLAVYNLKNPLQTFELRQASLKWINTAFPHIDWTSGIDWTGNGPQSQLYPGVNFVQILEGDESLVYFLNGPKGTGFSTNPKNPTAVWVQGQRIGPFFEFDSSRLQLLQHPLSNTAANGIVPARFRTNIWFPSYLDPYFRVINSGSALPQSKPYLYFTSGFQTNGYNLATGSPAPTWNPAGSDCLNFMPAGAYRKPTGPFYNPGSFQIVSAGRNQQFGPGALWTPANAIAIGQAGMDDMCNFHTEIMGVNP